MQNYVKPSVKETRALVAAHIAELEASAVDFSAAAFAGVYTIDHAKAHDLGIRGTGDLGGICYRYWDVVEKRFSTRFVRVKPDAVVLDRKYLQPVGERPRFYFVPGTSATKLDNVFLPVIIVEGEKKCLAVHRALGALDLSGLVIGLGGVWAWRRRGKELQADGTLGKGPSRPIEDFDLIAWRNRKVYVLFDSDVVTNWKVAAAETALAKELNRRGAKVHYARMGV